MFARRPQRKPKAQVESSSSSSESDIDVPLDDESDTAEFDSTEIIEGDFVVVKVAGKSRIVHYIARVDEIDFDECQGIFLQKVKGRVGSENSLFIPNPEDEASFSKDDIVHKLPEPKMVGGSMKRQGHLSFPCALKQWNLN